MTQMIKSIMSGRFNLIYPREGNNDRVQQIPKTRRGKTSSNKKPQKKYMIHSNTSNTQQGSPLKQDASTNQQQPPQRKKETTHTCALQRPSKAG